MILDGITVVDATTGLAGSVATRLLAEAGADVIKIEPPEGDPDRDLASFATWNRSKRSARLRLDDPLDRERLVRLLDRADVFVHGLSPKQASLLQLDDSELARHHPRLIVAAITPYPANHLDAERPGSDLLVQARSGLCDEQECHRPGPTFVRMPVPSWGAAYLACAAILTRLIVRQRTGAVGPARTSLLQGALSCMTLIWNHLESPSPRMAEKLPLPKRPSANTFRCSDGVWIQTAAGYWLVPLVTTTLATLGISAPDDHVDPGPAFAAIYQKAFATRPSADWLRACWEMDIATEALVSIGDPLRDPQAIANGYTTELDDPTWGPCRQAGLPFACDPPLGVRWPAPTLGEHDEEIERDDRAAVSASSPDVVGAQPLTYPLEGLKVLDLGMFVGGPYAAMLLADLGADVTKLESPTGDRMRLDELMFIASSRGKRSISIDLKKPAGRRILEKLVQWADVVHHNVRFDAAGRLGIDPASINAMNPRAIICHVSAFGPEGDKRDHPSFDPQMQATSGWMLTGAGAGNRPIWLRFPPTDVQCAQLSLIATLLAVYQRDKTGYGSGVEVSMLGGALMTNSETLLQLESDELAPFDAVDPAVCGVRAGHRLYETADGWIAVSIDRHDEKALLHEAFGTDNSLAIAAQLRAADTDPTCERLERLGVPVERVRRNHELQFFASEDNIRANLVVHHEHPVYGRMAQIGTYWDFGDLQTSDAMAPPTLGQHTREILLEHGFSRQDILEFSAQGAAFGDAIA